MNGTDPLLKLTGDISNQINSIYIFHRHTLLPSASVQLFLIINPRKPIFDAETHQVFFIRNDNVLQVEQFIRVIEKGGAGGVVMLMW